ncbi:MAG: heavy metal translocating P-type ATPase [Marinosulfonomonas sp.]
MDRTNSTRFEVTGLSCASCVRRAETALSSVPGVVSAGVNLATRNAVVEFTAPADIPGLLAAVSKAGYPALEHTISLQIEGATCASCVGRIEAALKAVPGVTGANMNLATGRADIRLVGASDRRADLVNAVRGAGYTVLTSQEAVAPHDSHRRLESALKRDFWLALALTLPVFLAEMGGHIYPPLHHWIGQTIGLQASWIAQFCLTTLVLIGPGRRFFAKGIPALIRRAPDMNSLVALGAGAAWAYSALATFTPGLFPAGALHVYFESAAMIVTLILLGRLLEARAKGRTGDAIRRLMDLTPDVATVERDGITQELTLDQLQPGDVLHLKPGERLAVDGVVISGQSYVDESMISGEPVPVEKTSGSAVTGGTVNGAGALTYRAVAVGQDTVLARIVAMVEDAQGAKLPIQALVDRITGWFVPAVLGLALITVLVWLVFGPDPAFSLALVSGVSVLIIACPCAMGLATPTSIMVGTGRAAELGVLFRRGDALQVLQGADVIALDKTGTLTAGHPVVTDFQVREGLEEDMVLALLAGVEAQSEHPIAQAIVRAAEQRNQTIPNVTEFKSLTGHGVQAKVKGKTVLIGADRLMADHGIDLGEFTALASAWAEAGKTPLFAAIDGAPAAVIAVSDPLKPTTSRAIRSLQENGLSVVMLTGDNSVTAKAIAQQLGIVDLRAELMPKDKVAALKDLQDRGHQVVFVGDGINDAPALAQADVGLAVGGGTDIAIEAADVVLMSGDLQTVVTALEISKRTMANIRQNLFWAFGYNVVLIPVAAGVLYPVLGVVLSPVLAAGAMAASSVFVVSNALRLRFFEPKERETV